MSKWLRFNDLNARGIVKSWAQLDRLIKLYGFPPGRMISPNARAWSEDDEVQPWLDSRPTAGPPLRGAAKAKHAAKRAGS